jgi:hypothetical protein
VPGDEPVVENSVPFWRILAAAVRFAVVQFTDDVHELPPAAIAQSGAVIEAIGAITHALPFHPVPEAQEAEAVSLARWVLPSKTVKVCVVPYGMVRLVPADEPVVENSVPFWRILVAPVKLAVDHVTETEQELFPAVIVQSGAEIEAVGVGALRMAVQLAFVPPYCPVQVHV